MTSLEVLRLVADDDTNKMKHLLKQEEFVITSFETLCSLIDNVNSCQMMKILLENIDRDAIEYSGSGKHEYSVITYTISRHNDIKIVKEIFAEDKTGINLSDGRGITPLMEAVWRRRDVNYIEELLKMGADVNVSCFNKMSLLHFIKRKELVQLLLKYGAEVDAKNSNGLTPLMLTLINDTDKEVVFELLNNGADVNAKDEQDKTPLMYAIDCDSDEEIVRKFIKNGANVDVNDIFGRSPLICALECDKNVRLVMELIDSGANVHVIDVDGNTVLHFVNDPDLINILVRRGVSINTKNNKHQTPLIKAVKSRKSIKVIESLLQNGADQNLLDFNLNSALHYAYSDKIVNLLIYYGGNVNVKNKYNRTPLQTILEFNDFFYQSSIIKHALLNDENITYTYLCDSKYGYFVEKCVVELNKMKQQCVVNDLTFYDLCNSSLNRSNNRSKFIDDLSGGNKFLYTYSDMISIFPIYHDVIYMKIKLIRIEKSKNDLLKKLNRVTLKSKSNVKQSNDDNIEECNVDVRSNIKPSDITCRTNCVALNYDCLYYICCYLNYRELYNLFIASM